MNDWFAQWRFHWRNFFRLSLVKPQPRKIDGAKTLAALPPVGMELLHKYAFTHWTDRLGQKDVLVNLYMLEQLEQLTTLVHWPTLQTVRHADIGSHTFYYAPALYHFWLHYLPVERMDGYEVDAYKRYRGLVSRYDLAQALLRQFPAQAPLRYIAGDFLTVTQRYNVITTFLPFVLPEPFRAWGLPHRLFRPEQLMAHIYAQLDSPGIWLIVNNGEDEWQRQHELLSALDISFHALGPFYSDLYDYDVVRYMTIVQK